MTMMIWSAAMRKKDGWKGDMESVQKPAPGELGIIHAFVNTADRMMGTERLTSPRELGNWLASQGLPSAGEELTEADLRRALAVREGLRALLAVNNGAALDAKAVARLEQAASPRFRVSFAGDGTGRLLTVSEGLDAAFGRLLAIVVAAQLGGEWKHLKACANPGCRGAFYDFTKNHSATWCATRRCGNLLNARAYRRFQRQLRAARVPYSFDTDDDDDS